MKDWPEKPYLEPKTAGRTYLEWLSTASERSRPTPQRPVGLEVLREQYRQNQPIKRKLLSFFDGRGDRALMRPVQRKCFCCDAGGPGGSVDRKVLSRRSNFSALRSE